MSAWPCNVDVPHVSGMRTLFIGGQQRVLIAALKKVFCKLCQHPFGFLWVQLCIRWLVQGVFVAVSGSLLLSMVPWSTPIAFPPVN